MKFYKKKFFSMNSLITYCSINIRFSFRNTSHNYFVGFSDHSSSFIEKKFLISLKQCEILHFITHINEILDIPLMNSLIMQCLISLTFFPSNRITYSFCRILRPHFMIPWKKKFFLIRSKQLKIPHLNLKSKLQ